MTTEIMACYIACKNLISVDVTSVGLLGVSERVTEFEVVVFVIVMVVLLL